MTEVRPAHVYVPAALAVTSPPTLEEFAANLYASLAPLAWMDDQAEWSLAKFSGAFGEMFQAVEEVARDTPEAPGWSAVMDLARCPDAWLPWLAQFVGVSVVPGSTPAAMRTRIMSTDGFRRGTTSAIRAATAATLTGSKTVILQERLAGDAYALGVYTITAETPNATQTRAAILSQKPGAIVLTYSTGAANTYEAVRIAYATYSAMRTAFSDYARLAANQPG